MGDVMIVNHERNMSKIGRRAEQLPAARRALAEALKREPTREEIAAKMSVTENDLALLEAFEQRGYDNGGFKIYDVSDPARPKLICYHKTGGIGVHRFDMDERHAYISTEMKGYVGNILVIYDLRDPRRPQEVSRWWMPGQHVEGGETPSWSGRRHRLHHALRFGDEMWASCWHAGFWVVDVSDLARPKGAGTYNYHPLFPEPTHTVMPVPRRGGPGAERERGGGAARARACVPADIRCQRSRRHQTARAVPGERARFALQPHERRPLQGAPVLRAYGGHRRLCRLVRRRPARHRRRRSAEPARDRPFHPAAGGGQTGAAEQRRRARRARADLHGRPPRRIRYFGVRRVSLGTMRGYLWMQMAPGDAVLDDENN